MMTNKTVQVLSPFQPPQREPTAIAYSRTAKLNATAPKATALPATTLDAPLDGRAPAACDAPLASKEVAAPFALATAELTTAVDVGVVEGKAPEAPEADPDEAEEAPEAAADPEGAAPPPEEGAATAWEGSVRAPIPQGIGSLVVGWRALAAAVDVPSAAAIVKRDVQ